MSWGDKEEFLLTVFQLKAYAGWERQAQRYSRGLRIPHIFAVGLTTFLWVNLSVWQQIKLSSSVTFVEQLLFVYCFTFPSPPGTSSRNVRLYFYCWNKKIYASNSYIPVCLYHAYARKILICVHRISCVIFTRLPFSLLIWLWFTLVTRRTSSFLIYQHCEEKNCNYGLLMLLLLLFHISLINTLIQILYEGSLKLQVWVGTEGYL